MAKLSATAKQGRVVAAKVARPKRAGAVTKATSRVSAAATTGDRATTTSNPPAEGARGKRAG